MKFVKRENIDVKKWDACVESASSFLYAYSWYLDEICPVWSALIIEKKDKYVACFPIPWKSKMGIKYVYPPFFIQQLGLFTVDDSIEIKPFIEKVIADFK